MAQDTPIFILKAGAFSLQTSVVPGGFRSDKGASYGEQIIPNRSSPVMFYGHGNRGNASVTIQLAAMTNASSEVSDVLASLESIVYTEGTPGTSTPPICYVTIGKLPHWQQRTCLCLNVSEHAGDHELYDNGHPMTGLVTLTFAILDLTNKKQSDLLRTGNFSQLSFPGST